MNAQKVKIICLNCKKSGIVQIIDERQVVYVDHTPIISSRFRGDLKLGFECVCGNNSLLAREEESQVDQLVQASDPNFKQSVIDNLIKSLKIKDENKFKVVPA